LLEDPEDFLFRLRGGEPFSDRAVVQEFCDRGKGAEMGLKLILRDDEEHNEPDRRIIERVELDALGRATESRDYFRDRVGRRMRNGNPKTDPCAHRFLALLERGEDGVAAGGIDFPQADEQVNQLDDRGPAFRRFHLGNDLLGREKADQRHAEFPESGAKA